MVNQWIDVDCGEESGLLGRFIFLQMLERRSAGQLEVREVEVEGWARSCGEISPHSTLSLLSLSRRFLSPDQSRP